MEDIVSNTDNIIFNIEMVLDKQEYAQPLLFERMDKPHAAPCVKFLTNECDRGELCPFRHLRKDKSVVCKHWIRGLCKKGDDCEFLHKYDLEKMPECYFYSKHKVCANKDCVFRHVDQEEKKVRCPWYDRGHCRHGASCKKRHERKVVCANFLIGYCVDGVNCKLAHAQFDLPVTDQACVICHECGEVGHKSTNCLKKIPQPGQVALTAAPTYVKRVPLAVPKHELPPLDQVTCFKCKQQGHYANKCPNPKAI